MNACSLDLRLFHYLLDTMNEIEGKKNGLYYVLNSEWCIQTAPLSFIVRTTNFFNHHSRRQFQSNSYWFITKNLPKHDAHAYERVECEILDFISMKYNMSNKICLVIHSCFSLQFISIQLRYLIHSSIYIVLNSLEGII